MESCQQNNVRPATSEEQLAKELLAGELEAFVRGQLKAVLQGRQ